MQLPKYLYITALIVGLILIGNLVLLDYFFISQRAQLLDLKAKQTQFSTSLQTLNGRVLTGTINANTNIPAPEKTTPAPKPAETVDACSKTCLTAIDTAIKAASLPRQTIVTTPTTTPSSTKGEYIIPLGSGSLSALNTWTDINTAQASFDTNNYSSIKAFYFEVVMHIPSAQGEVRARLIDTTTPFIYAGEELKTTSGTGQLLTTSIPLRSGSKTYKIQMYTTIDTATLDQARIRIVTQ